MMYKFINLFLFSYKINNYTDLNLVHFNAIPHKPVKNIMLISKLSTY